MSESRAELAKVLREMSARALADEATYVGEEIRAFTRGQAAAYAHAADMVDGAELRPHE